MASLRQLPLLAFLALSASFGPVADTAPAPEGASQTPIGVVTQIRLEGSSYLTPLIKEPTYRAFRSREDLKDYWEYLQKYTLNAPPPMPEVDFTKSILIMAAVGERSHGGDTVHFSTYQETADRILVNVEDRQLGGLCLMPASVSYPSAFGTIPKTSKRIDFQITNVVTTCSSF